MGINDITPSGIRPSKSDKLYIDALCGNPESQVQIGYNFRKCGDTNEAEKWFFKALDQGYNYANFQIGLLKYALPMEANNSSQLAWEQAYPWFQKGAAGGCFHSQWEIDHYYDKQYEAEEELRKEKLRKEGDSWAKQIFELIFVIIGLCVMGYVGTWLLAGAMFINSITIPLIIIGYIVYKIFQAFK